MRRVGVGMQEAHGHRLDIIGLETRTDFTNLIHIEGFEYVTGGFDAFGDLVGCPTRHQRAGAVEMPIIGFRPVSAPDDIDIARSTGDQQRGFGSLAFDQRIDCRCGAVDEIGDIGRVESAFRDAIDDALGKIKRRGQAFA
jgi:hypothetical protein